MRATGILRRTAPLLLAALTIAALTTTVASGSDGGPGATASAAQCSGKAFSPGRQGNSIAARGSLTCTGDVGKMRIRTCLEQEVFGRFRTVECDTTVRFGPGKVIARAVHFCAEDTAHAFRNRSFLFLLDRNGQKRFGKAVSDLRVYSRRCN